MKSSDKKTGEVERIMSILHKWGVHTVGDFAALDKIDISARLGPEAVRMWDRANGKSTRLLKLVDPPESFAESFEFEHDVETSEPLLFILRRFLQQLSTRLSGIYLVIEELILRMNFRDGQQYERCFKIPQPTNDVDLLFRMLHTHLENFKSEHPIIAVSLDAQPAKPAQQQFGLFETALRNPAQLSETLARLIALLGSDRVGTPVVEETHRPDAFYLEPFVWNSNENPNITDRPHPTLSLRERRACESTAVRGCSGAVLRRFRPYLPASVFLEGNKPIHLQSNEVTGAALHRNGPYLASGNWWDEKTWSRNEWDLELNSGALVRCHHNESGWQIDGIYD
jgi:protein ImuB